MKKLILTALLALTIAVGAQPQTTMDNPALDNRQQALVTLAAFEAKGDQTALAKTLDEALDGPLTVSEAKEALSQLYAYTGFPRSLNALGTLQTVIANRQAAGKATPEGRDASPLAADYNALEQGTKVQTQLTGRGFNYAFAPATDYYLKAHLFGDIFARDNLSFADRELVTIGALSALEGVEPQRRSHMAGALNMGVTEAELLAIPAVLTQNVGSTEGRRAALTTIEVLGEESLRKEGESGTEAICARLMGCGKAAGQAPMTAGSGQLSGTAVPGTGDGIPPLTFPIGQTNDAYAQYFIGQSYLANVTTGGGQIPVNNVTFEPGCRNNWHIHHGFHQILICVCGNGWYQEWGKPAQALHPGDVVDIPDGVKHWHGAQANSWFQHLTYHTLSDQGSNEWLEPVDDEQYNALCADEQ